MDIDKIYRFAQVYEEAFQKEEAAVGELLDYIGQMEPKFIQARDGVEDPIKKVVLTGMYSDWLNFKAEKWRESIYMLTKAEPFITE